jgi:N-acetylglucosaminyldiphosphoundecaprenol N-acetyl-beta-D-mannosaminyltransferase
VNAPVSPLAAAQTYPKFDVLGVGIAATHIPGVIAQMESCIAERCGCHFIAVTTMHGVVEAHHDAAFKRILNAADLVVPDGMSLVWVARSRGFPLRRRVYGPELMATFCAHDARGRYRHFFYGGTPGIATRLSKSLRQRFPELKVAGTCSPPFRPLTYDEDEQHVRQINESQADVVWVSLSEIKQDTWMFEHRDRLRVPVLVGVGAAFDFHSGAKRQAPEWMRENGFEWLFRLLQEPRRLWRRYLICGPEFVFRVAMEQLGLRRSD